MSPFPMSEEVRTALRRIDGGERAADLESENLDFKSDRGGRKEALQTLARAASCLANRRGGTLVLGVEDSRSGPEAFSA